MQGFNRLILAGNLTRDPELRHTESGMSVVQFGMAVNRTWNDANGQKKEEVLFIDVEAWGKLAEIASKHLSKGRPVLAEGRLKQDKWEDKETHAPRSKIKMVMEHMTFLGGVESSTATNHKGAPPRNKDTPKSTEQPDELAEDDVPF